MLTSQVMQKLKPGAYTVIVSAKVNGQRAETRWSFNVAPGSN
jgi:tRNA A37 threonylcarbamoyladenosine synthetase subunit TsaC/SUA5/YrdC